MAKSRFLPNPPTYPQQLASSPPEKKKCRRPDITRPGGGETKYIQTTFLKDFFIFCLFILGMLLCNSKHGQPRDSERNTRKHVHILRFVYITFNHLVLFACYIFRYSERIRCLFTICSRSMNCVDRKVSYEMISMKCCEYQELIN